MFAATGVRHGQRVAHGHGGVDGVAAVAKNGRAHLRGEVLSADYHAFRGFRGEWRCGVGEGEGQGRGGEGEEGRESLHHVIHHS